MKLIDLTGQKFERLTVVSRVNGKWLCKCDCGNETFAPSSGLRNGDNKSCGCLYKESRKTCNSTHGKSSSKTYNSWQKMIDRCTNPKHPSFKNYGAKGITFCHEWKTFDGFLSDMGDRPEGKTLDRIENSKGYSKSNCKWSTRTEQNNNTSRNKFIEYKGVKYTCAQFSRTICSDITPEAVASRLAMGWSTDRIITQLLQKKRVTC